jgi:hypothetical protein
MCKSIVREAGRIKELDHSIEVVTEEEINHIKDQTIIKMIITSNTGNTKDKSQSMSKLEKDMRNKNLLKNRNFTQKKKMINQKKRNYQKKVFVLFNKSSTTANRTSL